MRYDHGFTLMELVMVIVVVGVGLVGLTPLFDVAATSLSTNERAQQAAQYAQECAERVLATRRASTFGWATSTSINASLCNSTTDSPAGQLPPMAAGYARSVDVTTISGTGSPCPSGTDNCKNVLVTVTSGGLTSSITVMLVDY